VAAVTFASHLVGQPSDSDPIRQSAISTVLAPLLFSARFLPFSRPDARCSDDRSNGVVRIHGFILRLDSEYLKGKS